MAQARLVSIHQGGSTQVLDFRRMAGLDLLSAMLMTPDGGLDLGVLRSVIEMRSILTPDIARLAALRGGQELADHLDGVLLRMRQHSEDVPTLQQLALEFWNFLVDGSENVAYQLSFNSMRETYEVFGHLLADVLADEFRDLESYQAICVGVREQDSEGARATAHALIERGAVRIHGMLQGMANYTAKEQGT